MKRIIYFIIVITIISCLPKSGQNVLFDTSDNLAKPNFDFHVDVISITDGDTFKGLNDDGIEIRFRLQGIDAPEREQDFYNKSKTKLSDLIFGKRVGIKVHTEKDFFGRPVVYVYTPDGRDVGAEMLKSGMAWHFKRYDKSESYNNLEIEARKKRIGLWIDDNPTPPWEFKKREK